MSVQAKLDKATKLTDAQERAFIASLTREYTKAYNEIKKQIASAVADYGIDGNMDPVAMAKYSRMETLQKSIEAELYTLNKLKAVQIEDYLVDTYNVNYYNTAFALETTAQVKLGYGLLPRKSVVEGLFTPLDKIALQNNAEAVVRSIRSSLVQGIMQGQSVPKMASAVKSDLEKNANNATRIVRTETTRIMNKARLDSMLHAEAKGLPMKKIWVATLDNRTRDSHAELDGQERKLDEPYSNGLMYPGDQTGDAAEVINCFIGTTKISADSKIINAYKHFYDGELVTITTASGIQLTGTPNHPILTNNGWVALDKLNESSNVVCTSMDINPSSSNPNVNSVNAMFSNLFDALSSIWHVGRVASALVDFHGDVPNSNVEIVFEKSHLRNGIKTKFGKTSHKIKFVFSNFVHRFLISNSFVKQFRFGSFRTTASKVCSESKFSPGLNIGLGHPEIHGFGSPSWNDSVVSKSVSYYSSGNTEITSKLLDGRSGSVFLDKVVNVNRYNSAVHVYNLHTESNYYIANSSLTDNGDKNNGIIVHNCRCAQITQIEGLDNIKDQRRAEGKVIPYTTYADWYKNRVVNSN